MRVLVAVVVALAAAGCASSLTGDPAPSSAVPGSPEHPIVAAEIARACLLATGCAAAPVGSLGACVRSLTRRALDPRPIGEGLWDRLLHCAARPEQRATCAAFVACATHGHPASYCAAHPGDSCDGATAVHCAGAAGPAVAEDCATIPGASCATLDGPDARTYCAASACSPTCAGSVAEVSCAGAPAQYAHRCTAGMSCEIARCCAGIYGACVPPGPACATADARCEGSTLVRCTGGLASNLRETRVDCARLGWGCGVSDEGATTCVPPPFACALDGPPACEGDTLVACAGGANPRFDCRALGFARCAPAMKGQPARCVP